MYKQLILEQKYTIFILLQNGTKKKDIAKAIAIQSLRKVHHCGKRDRIRMSRNDCKEYRNKGIFCRSALFIAEGCH